MTTRDPPQARREPRPSEQLRRDGYTLVPRVLDTAACLALAAAMPAAPPRAGGLRDPLRNIGAHNSPALRALDALAASLLGTPTHAVRAILFDKTAASNWAVAWHQDLAIPVLERHEVAGYRNWSRKQGVWHVLPPQAVLDGMLTLRLHLDDCDAHNAPLQVLPGSHVLGRLDAERTAELVGGGGAVTCSARAGDVLAMRPGLLHASAKALRPRRRRILHVEYAAHDLPAPLRWQRAWDEVVSP